MNIYAYAGNDPVNHTDPMGTNPTEVASAGSSLIGDEGALTATSTTPSSTGLVASSGGNGFGDDFDFYMQQAQSLDVSTAPNTAVFYSGPGNRGLAEDFATANGRTTLEQTSGGAWLDSQQLFAPGSPLTPDQAAASPQIGISRAMDVSLDFIQAVTCASNEKYTPCDNIPLCRIAFCCKN